MKQINENRKRKSTLRASSSSCGLPPIVDILATSSSNINDGTQDSTIPFMHSSSSVEPPTTVKRRRKRSDPSLFVSCLRDISSNRPKGSHGIPNQREPRVAVSHGQIPSSSLRSSMSHDGPAAVDLDPVPPPTLHIPASSTVRVEPVSVPAQIDAFSRSHMRYHVGQLPFTQSLPFNEHPLHVDGKKRVRSILNQIIGRTQMFHAKLDAFFTTSGKKKLTASRVTTPSMDTGGETSGACFAKVPTSAGNKGTQGRGNTKKRNRTATA